MDIATFDHTQVAILCIYKNDMHFHCYIIHYMSMIAYSTMLSKLILIQLQINTINYGIAKQYVMHVLLYVTLSHRHEHNHDRSTY